jgi:hypothetical protein
VLVGVADFVLEKSFPFGAGLYVEHTPVWVIHYSDLLKAHLIVGYDVHLLQDYSLYRQVALIGIFHLECVPSFAPSLGLMFFANYGCRFYDDHLPYTCYLQVGWYWRLVGLKNLELCFCEYVSTAGLLATP